MHVSVKKTTETMEREVVWGPDALLSKYTILASKIKAATIKIEKASIYQVQTTVFM